MCLSTYLSIDLHFSELDLSGIILCSFPPPSPCPTSFLSFFLSFFFFFFFFFLSFFLFPTFVCFCLLACFSWVLFVCLCVMFYLCACLCVCFFLPVCSSFCLHLLIMLLWRGRRLYWLLPACPLLSFAKFSRNRKLEWGQGLVLPEEMQRWRTNHWQRQSPKVYSCTARCVSWSRYACEFKLSTYLTGFVTNRST